MWGTLVVEAGDDVVDRFIPTHVGNTSAASLSSDCESVHPHACGEHAPDRALEPDHVGSSPRMWGTLVIPPVRRSGRRFIPTHVGNTSSARRPGRTTTVHPHACGEHFVSLCSGPCFAGSSPRMWGTLLWPVIPAVANRFIPTHVGNTGPGPSRSRLPPVHPHACGEHLSSSIFNASCAGSSPRMWGTRVNSRTSQSHCRFIPTHVGNTLCRAAGLRRTPVHPHACGEHGTATGWDRREVGSSPRMWGTQGPTATWPVGTSVHPHACGEHGSGTTLPATGYGSSPRMWGTRGHQHEQRLGERFIPTHVGNTRHRGSGWLRPAVHPHACGEHATGFMVGCRSDGSSPRMWGTRPICPRRIRGARFIPTHVGNTNNLGFRGVC